MYLACYCENWYVFARDSGFYYLLVQLWCAFMKTAIRLYLNTSRGNDPFLYRELLSMDIRPKFDQHLHAFYFDTYLPNLFHLSFHSLIAQNMYIQIGKPFPAISQTGFVQSLDRIQFKNFLPIQRGLIENLTLNILVRETQFPISNNVITAFIHDALQRQIVKKQYLVDVLGGNKSRGEDKLISYYEMREIVDRKWEQEDNLRLIEHQKLLTGLTPKNLQNQSHNIPAINGPFKKNSLDKIQKSQIQDHLINQELTSKLPFHPHLTFYLRRNQGRILMKVNQQQMYKHGWKKRVGWGPIRESIVASILDQTQILKDQKESIRLWDPFCGSGTFPLVAASQYYQIGVRGQIQSNFNWPHWKIYKPEYLSQYLSEREKRFRQKESSLKLISSDINFQSVNYTIGNLKELAKQFPINTEQNTKKQKVVARIKPTDQIYEIKSGQWIVICGDFQKVAQNVLFSEQKVNIITNLPYTEGRSAEHIPLNQLNSIYRRFSKMIKDNKDKISNVFIIINNEATQITNRNHFLNISSEQWNLVASFESGGMPIGLYSWKQNEKSIQYQDYNAIYQQIIADRQQIQLLPQDKDLKIYLTNYRQKIRQIENKNYFIPKHLLVIKSGWKRIVQKRRRRHLLRAYQIFSKRRDKMQAFSQYANKKLELGLLRRGSIWRKRNIRLLANTNILDLQKQLKKQFEGRIQAALEKSQQRQKNRQERLNQKKQDDYKEIKQKEKLKNSSQKNKKTINSFKRNKNRMTNKRKSQ